MMRKIFLLPFLLYTGTLLAQDPQVFAYRPFWPDASAGLHHAIGFSGEYAAGSDAISNSFFNHLYQGGFIDSAEKTEQESRLLPMNRFGGYTGLSVSYLWRQPADTLKWEFMISYRDRQSVFGTFTNDAFKLAFEGNRPFLGETADVSGSKLTLLHWQQLQFEAKYFSTDHRSEMTFGISVLNGQQFQEVNIRTGKLFTPTTGAFLDATADASYYTSDTMNTGFGSRNGSGNCFNFRFSTILGDSVAKYHSQLMFSVQDLGFIKWNNHSQVYNVDTSMNYTGVDATNAILDPNDLTGIPNSDSLIGKGKNGQVISFLPIGIRGRYTLLTPFKWWGGLDARIWSYTGASTQLTLFAGWHSTNFKVSTSGGVAWGGFSRLQFPIQVGYSPCKNFGFVLGTTNLGGYIVPKKSSGQGLFMNMSFAF